MVVVREARALPGTASRVIAMHRSRPLFAQAVAGRTRDQLIETETIDALGDLGVKVFAAETRRNVATRGVPLNHLVDHVFRVGEVRCAARGSASRASTWTASRATASWRRSSTAAGCARRFSAGVSSGSATSCGPSSERARGAMPPKVTIYTNVG